MPDGPGPLPPVSTTAIGVAAVRAAEAAQPVPLFVDPLAPVFVRAAQTFWTVDRDELASALNIADVASCVRDEVSRRPRVLIERIAVDVARALLARFERVTEVRVKVEKPEPAGLDAAAEAVEIAISR